MGFCPIINDKCKGSECEWSYNDAGIYVCTIPILTERIESLRDILGKLEGSGV